MPKKKTQLDRFSDLTWSDIAAWAGGKIVSWGQNYQRQGRVADPGGFRLTDLGPWLGPSRPGRWQDRRGPRQDG